MRETDQHDRQDQVHPDDLDELKGFLESQGFVVKETPQDGESPSHRAITIHSPDGKTRKSIVFPRRLTPPQKKRFREQVINIVKALTPGLLRAAFDAVKEKIGDIFDNL